MTALRAGSATDTGRVRSINQDAVLVTEGVFAVADGMGGHVAGEVAAQVALEAFASQDERTLRGLVAAVHRANQAVLERASQEPDLQGMGTTLCAIALVPGDAESAGAGERQQVAVVNVGDSRVYLFHDGDMDQISEDHSLVEDMVRAGRLSPDEARTHPRKNIVTRVLGNEADVEVDSWEVDPHEGDRFLLCSDGLCNEVSDEDIATVLGRIVDPEDAAHELVTLALRGGGRDNVTVVVADVVDEEDSAAARASTSEPTTAVGPIVADAPPSGGDDQAPGSSSRSRPRHGAQDQAAHRRVKRRRVTWRSALFVMAVLLVAGGATVAVGWFARGSYFVGVDDGEVAVFKGRPGGLLWFKPTLEEETGLDIGDVPTARRDEIREGKEQSSVTEARRYVANLEELAEEQRARTTTTTTTTSLAPPGGP